MKLVVSYVRLSEKDRNLKELYSDSINHQRILIKNYAKDIGIVIDKEYIDDGCSGGNFERPAFNQLLEDIEGGNISTVITKDFSRLGRNFVDTAYYITEYFTLNDVRYIAINDSFDSKKDDSMVNDLMVGIKSLVSDKFLKDTSERVRKAKQQKSEEKNFMGFIAPYGYKKVKDNGRITFIIDEEVAPIVRRIFKEMSEGRFAREIANDLNNELVIAPFDYMKMTESKGKNYYHKWNKSIIYRIIKNISYTGNLFYRKSNSIDYHNKKKRKFIKYDDRDIIKDTHEAIISMELFNLANNSLRHNSGSEKCNYDGVYKNLIYCGECGNSLKVTNTEKRKKRTIQFYCIHYNAGERDFSFGIYLSKIDKVIKNILKDIIKNYLDTDEIINKIVDGILKDDKVESKISNLQNVITQNRLQIKNQYIMKTKGDITLEQFLKFKEEKNNLIEKNEKIIEQLNARYDKDSLIKLVKEKYESFTEDEEVFNIVVKELIEKIILYRDRTIKINFKFKKLDSYSIKLY